MVLGGVKDQCYLREKNIGSSLVVQWLGLRAFTAGTWVQCLLEELRSQKLSGAAKKKKKKKRKEREREISIRSFSSNSKSPHPFLWLFYCPSGQYDCSLEHFLPVERISFCRDSLFRNQFLSFVFTNFSLTLFPRQTQC